MEEFFDFIAKLEDEGQQKLVLLDITGNTNRTNRYRIVCPFPACSFSLTWSLAIEFKNDMKCHAKLIPANAFRTYHEHNSTRQTQRMLVKELGGVFRNNDNSTQSRRIQTENE